MRPTATLRCCALLLVLSQLGLPVRADDWPQWMGPQRDGVWRETGIVEAFPKDGPPVRWRVKIGGGYAGPAVVGDRVFVTDKLLPTGATNPNNPFERGRQAATERVLCLNDADGSVVWKHEYSCPYTVSYPAGPRTTPVVRDDRVYTLGSEGHLLCLNAQDGTVVWSKNFKEEYGRRTTPVWGYSANPLLDGDRLICLVGGEGTTVVAFHKDTGKELWRALDSTDRHGPGYGSPIIVEAGGQRQLIVWHPSAVSSLDPTTGKVFWNQPFDVKEGLTVATPRVSGDKLFVSAFYDGSLLLKLDATKPAASVVWRRHGQNERLTDALHCLISTPVIDNGHIYGACSYGEFRCLDLATGDRKWSTFQPTSGESLRWGTAFIVKHEDRYFLFSEKGDLIVAKLSPPPTRNSAEPTCLSPPARPNAATSSGPTPPSPTVPYTPATTRKSFPCRWRRSRTPEDLSPRGWGRASSPAPRGVIARMLGARRLDPSHTPHTRELHGCWRSRRMSARGRPPGSPQRRRISSSEKGDKSLSETRPAATG